MKLFLKGFICAVFLMMMACTQHSNTTPVADKAQKTMCLERCNQQLTACRAVCNNNCVRCNVALNEVTARHYNQYIHEVNVEGGTVSRDLNSYRDVLQCRKPTCECRADHQVCVQSCGGVINKKLQVPPVCQ